MKIKKTSLFTILTAVALIASFASVFVTSAATQSEPQSELQQDPTLPNDSVSNSYDNVESDDVAQLSHQDLELINGDNTSINESEILVYITNMDANNISVDVIEWVTVPSSRADELGIKEEDGPNGFYIYNPDTLTEKFTLSADCTIKVLDWQNSYEPQTISAEKFVAVLQERGEQNNFIPYSFKITNGTITEISEHYVP